MGEFLWVGLGGLLGSIVRYAVAIGIGGTEPDRFPWATFVVNCIGCLLIGLLAGWFASAPVPEAARLFLITGVLGGFTTFSAFGLESLSLMRNGELALALLYILSSVLVGVLAVWIGVRIGS
ncbi:MAG: fluoride efflux transporter CrcB [Steroidobacteraceae bacterium]|nr:fluoride efflux transporter CrcB [Steroidobacteraceae bacterium]